MRGENQNNKVFEDAFENLYILQQSDYILKMC